MKNKIILLVKTYPQPCTQPITMEWHPWKTGRGHMDRKSVGPGKGDFLEMRSNDKKADATDGP